MHGMSDQDILNDCLHSQKDIAHQYLEAAHHTDDQQLLQVLMGICQEEQQARLQIYEAMHRRGWYNPQAINPQQVQQLQQSMEQKQSQLRQLQSQGQQRQQQQPTQHNQFQPSNQSYQHPIQTW